MKTTKRIPISVLKKLCTELNQTQLILIAFNSNTGVTSCVTYGKSIKECEQAAYGGNRIKREILNFPEELCNTVPRRLKNKK